LAAEQTDAPFADALRDLIAERGLSLRTLAALTPAIDGRGLRHSYLGALVRGKRPTTANMLLLARALEVDPMYWREYREQRVADKARELAHRHGAELVLAKLAELDA
jgi:transcriptional regulator with XRE-family HTH domain